MFPLFLWCDKDDYFSMFCKMFYMILLTVTLKRSFHIHVVNILPQGLCTKVPYHSCGVNPLQVISWGLCFLCSRDFVILWSFIPHDFNLIHKFISLYLVKGMWYLCLSQDYVVHLSSFILCGVYPKIFQAFPPWSEIWEQSNFFIFFILFSFLCRKL